MIMDLSGTAGDMLETIGHPHTNQDGETFTGRVRQDGTGEFTEKPIEGDTLTCSLSGDMYLVLDFHLVAGVYKGRMHRIWNTAVLTRCPSDTQKDDFGKDLVTSIEITSGVPVHVSVKRRRRILEGPDRTLIQGSYVIMINRSYQPQVADRLTIEDKEYIVQVIDKSEWSNIWCCWSTDGN